MCVFVCVCVCMSSPLSGKISLYQYTKKIKNNDSNIKYVLYAGPGSSHHSWGVCTRLLEEGQALSGPGERGLGSG